MRALGGALGASWGALGSIFFGGQILIDWWIDFGIEKGAQRDAFWEPKWCQNRFKNEVENEDEKRRSWEPLGSIFGFFGGASWGEKTSKSVGGANIS